MSKFVLLVVILTIGAAGARADQIKNGVYNWKIKGTGPMLKRNDGAKIILGERLGDKFGTATIRSVRNDNSLFSLDLKNAGPLNKNAGKSNMVLLIDGVCLPVTGYSDRRGDGTMDVHAQVNREDTAQKIAMRLRAQVQRRTDPGHRLRVRWRPTKKSFQIGEKATLKMELRNVGPVTVRFRVGGQQRGFRDNQYRFLAYRSSGYGKAVPDTGNPTNFGGISYNKTLKPGETFTASVPLDKWFKFTQPDSYRITGIYELELHDPNSDKYRPIWNDLVVGDCVVTFVGKKK